jgi:hypothetical protein
MATGSKYQIALLGRPGPDRQPFETALFRQVNELGLSRSQIAIFEESNIARTDPKAPLVSLFFGYAGASDTDHPALTALLGDATTIIPCVAVGAGVEGNLPKSIGHVNAFPMNGPAAGPERLASLVLENLRLLRSERRLFISYKRNDSQNIAIQLYEMFDQAGFDVFLDTRSVPFGVDFQGVLWHRMADSDVVVLLDTPSFRASRWTMQELSHANATSIQILHLLWPKVAPDPASAFSRFVTLASSDFRGRARTGQRARLTDAAAHAIVQRAEGLRARALAARHRNLVDGFCDCARAEKAKSVVVQPQRFITVELAGAGKVAVVPTIGVPRADRYHDIETAIRNHDPDAKEIWLLYDERGILQTWLDHLNWLDGHLPVRSIQASRCVSALRRSIA